MNLFKFNKISTFKVFTDKRECTGALNISLDILTHDSFKRYTKMAAIQFFRYFTNEILILFKNLLLKRYSLSMVSQMDHQWMQKNGANDTEAIKIKLPYSGHSHQKRRQKERKKFE